MELCEDQNDTCEVHYNPIGGEFMRRVDKKSIKDNNGTEFSMSQIQEVMGYTSDSSSGSVVSDITRSLSTRQCTSSSSVISAFSIDSILGRKDSRRLDDQVKTEEKPVVASSNSGSHQLYQHSKYIFKCHCTHLFY